MEKFNYMDNIKKLEGLLKSLEEEEDIMKSLDIFKEAIRVHEACEKELNKAEGEVKLLVEKDQDIFDEIDFISEG